MAGEGMKSGSNPIQMTVTWRTHVIETHHATIDLAYYPETERILLGDDPNTDPEEWIAQFEDFPDESAVIERTDIEVEEK